MATREKQSLMFNNAGFTLAELLTTVSVLSILAAIAAPNITSQLQIYRLNGAARQVLGDLMWARAKAVKDVGQYVVVIPNTTTATYTIVDDEDKSGGKTNAEWFNPQDIQDNYPDVTLTKGIDPGSGLSYPDPTFSSRGTASAFTKINITNPSGITKTITVNRTGSVRIN